MSERVEEAIQVLTELGMPKEQLNARTAYVLLALLELPPDRPWSAAQGVQRWRTVELMNWVATNYGMRYAPNSRETIRRFSLHQLVEAGLVLYNPDKPDRAVNSPQNCYQIAPETLAIVRAFGTPKWGPSLAPFLKLKPGLASKYAMARDLAHIPVSFAGGKLHLSPGEHSELIRDIVEGFGARFVPGGELIYAGDTGNKLGHFDKDLLAHLGVEVNDHGKLPDVVLYDSARNWLVLVEAATSHGPVDNKRQVELTRLFAGAKAGLVYVSAFPNRATMRKYLDQLAWETEVWVADAPDHLVHFNGDRYLGPH